MSQLLNKTSLNLYRVDGSSGYLDDNNNWVKGAETVIPIKCSLQPYRNGRTERDLPDGVYSEDAFFVYSKSEMLTTDEFSNRVADQIEIDGRRYECFFSEPWVFYNLQADHYKAIFIKKDKLGVS